MRNYCSLQYTLHIWVMGKGGGPEAAQVRRARGQEREGAVRAVLANLLQRYQANSRIFELLGVPYISANIPLLQIKQCSQYRSTQLQDRFASISEAPSIKS